MTESTRPRPPGVFIAIPDQITQRQIVNALAALGFDPSVLVESVVMDAHEVKATVMYSTIVNAARTRATATVVIPVVRDGQESPRDVPSAT